MKPNSKAFTVNILVKIEEVDFNAPGLSLHHRTIPDVQHSLKDAPRVLSSYSINALSRYQLIGRFNAQVGGGETDGPPDVVALYNHSRK